MKRGSITVFLALTLILVLSFLFSLLESARVSCMQAKAWEVTNVSMQSLFGNYQKGIWEDYHLLFLDGSWQGEEFSMEKFAARAMEELTENLSFSAEQAGGRFWDLVDLEPIGFETAAYELATDREGAVFREQAARQMKLEAAKDALKELIPIQELAKEAGAKKDAANGKWDAALEAMDTAEEQLAAEEAERGAEGTGGAGNGPLVGQGDINRGEQEGTEGSAGTKEENTSENSGPKEEPEDIEEEEAGTENPMEYVKGLRSSAVLSLVLEDPSGLSGKGLDSKDFLEKRKLNRGLERSGAESEAAVTDRLWLQYYIQKFFSNYTGQSELGPPTRALDYEMEYLIGGNSKDGENLEKAALELLVLREAMNFATIMGDGGKKALALELATAVVGFTGILPLIKAVQIGILLAWAFIESVLDVRSLLAGGKIPFLKRTDQWASDLTDSRGAIENNSKAGEDESGLDYTQYLQLLLLLLPSKTLNYRCMDLIERNEQVQMDTMLQSAECLASYQGSPLFWNLNWLSKRGWDNFVFSGSGKIAYGKIR